MDRRAKIIAALTFVIVAGGSFIAGMEFQSYRITAGLQEAFGELGEDEVEVVEEAVQESDPVPLGETVEWIPDSSTPEVVWTVSVDSVTCGLKQIDDAAENEAYWEDMTGTEPEYIAADASDGEDFCTVESTWVNSGSAASTISSYDSISGLVIDDKQFKSSSDDESYSSRLTDGFDETVNPDGDVSVTQVFTVPEGSEPTAAFLTPVVSFDDADQTLIFSAR